MSMCHTVFSPFNTMFEVFLSPYYNYFYPKQPSGKALGW